MFKLKCNYTSFISNLHSVFLHKLNLCLIIIWGLLCAKSCSSFGRIEMGLLLAPVFEEFPWSVVERHTEKCQGSHQDMDQMLRTTERGMTLQLGSISQVVLHSCTPTALTSWPLQRTLGTFWRHFWLLQLEEGEMCYSVQWVKARDKK